MNKPSNATENTSGSLTILYIEDDPASKKVLSELMVNFPTLKLVTAWSAEEGIGLAKKLQPHLIFLDINLPCMSGREAFTELKKDGNFANTTIIALSADALAKNIQSALEMGFDHYLTKPINLKEVSQIINDIFLS